MSENREKFEIMLKDFLTQLDKIKDKNNLLDFTDALLKDIFFISQNINTTKSIDINILVNKNISNLFHKSKEMFVFNEVADKSLKFFKENLINKDTFDKFNTYLNFFYTAISFNNLYIEILNSLNIQINEFNSNIASHNKIDKEYFFNLSKNCTDITKYTTFYTKKNIIKIPKINLEKLHISDRLNEVDKELELLEIEERKSRKRKFEGGNEQHTSKKDFNISFL